MDLKEKDIKRQINSYLTAQDIFHFHIMQGMGSYKGIPDIIFQTKGKTVFLEVKTKTGVQSEWQKLFQTKLEAHGGKYLLVRSIDEVIEFIESENLAKQQRLFK